MRPYPHTTPSPGNCCSCIPKSRHRWVTNLSSSSKESLSSSSVMRSRAVSLPSAFCRSRRSLPPPSSAARFNSIRLSMRSEAVVLATKFTEPLDFLDLFPILQELFDTFVREWMLEELIENLRRHRADVGTHQSSLDDVDGIPNGRNQDLSLEFVIVEDRYDRFDKIHSAFGDVVQPSYKRTHKVSAGFGCHNCLRRRKHKSHIHTNAFFGKNLRRLQAFLGHRAFNNDVGMELR